MSPSAERDDQPLAPHHRPHFSPAPQLMNGHHHFKSHRVELALHRRSLHDRAARRATLRRASPGMPLPAEREENDVMDPVSLVTSAAVEAAKSPAATELSKTFGTLAYERFAPLMRA